MYKRQEKSLHEIRDEYENKVLVYAIDYTLDEPMTKLVKDAFSVNITPTVVIKGSVLQKPTKNDVELIVSEILEK